MGRTAGTAELIAAMAAPAPEGLGRAVTRQTICVWCKHGLPHDLAAPTHPRPGARPENRFDLAEALAWIKANKPEGRVGGKREGAGRKPSAEGTEAHREKGTKAQRHGGTEARGDEGTEGAGDQGIKGEKPDPSVLPTSAANWLELALADPKKGGLSTADAERERRIFETYQKRLEAERLAGNLVPLDETLDAWAEQLATLKTAMEAAAERVTPVIQAEINLTHEQAVTLQRRLARWARETLETIAGEAAKAAA